MIILNANVAVVQSDAIHKKVAQKGKILAYPTVKDDRDKQIYFLEMLELITYARTGGSQDEKRLSSLIESLD